MFDPCSIEELRSAILTAYGYISGDKELMLTYLSASCHEVVQCISDTGFGVDLGRDFCIGSIDRFSDMWFNVTGVRLGD